METSKATFLLWVQSHFRKIIYKVFCGVESSWFNTIYYTVEIFLSRRCTLKLSFTSIRNFKKKCVKPLLFYLLFSFWWDSYLGIWQEIGGQRAGASHTSWLIDFRSRMKATDSVGLSYWGGIPKDTSIRFQREPSQSYLFTAFSTSLQSQTRASLLSSLCPTLLLHLHRSVHQKFPPVFNILSLLRTYLTLNRQRSSHAH